MSNLSSRPYHAFLSYSHADREKAIAFHRWLTRDAGYKIWFDENQLEAGSPVATRLAEQMAECRNWIVLASKNSIGSSWVTAERDQALHCAVDTHGFNPLILRIDDCPLGKAWPSISRYNWLEMPGAILTPLIARELIDRLDGRTWSKRQTGLRDVYVSRGWRQADHAFADTVCENLCARPWRLRLIGDAPDQPAFSTDRIRKIIASCSGHVLILPQRAGEGGPTEHDYRYFTRELAISQELGIPILSIAASATTLPPSLAPSVVRLAPGDAFISPDLVDPPVWLEKFLDDLKTPPSAQHFFLAAEFKDNIDRVEQLREVIEAVTGMTCHIGRDFEGQGLRDQIVSKAVTASLVIANLSSYDEATRGHNGVNVNTCVEAGMAIGASTAAVLAGGQPKPIFLTSQCLPDEKNRTARIPFMFRDSQITWYTSESELFGHCRRLLFPFRRRVMNYEFNKPT